MTYKIEVSKTQLERIKAAIHALDAADRPDPDNFDIDLLYGCICDTLAHADTPENRALTHGWCV